MIEPRSTYAIATDEHDQLWLKMSDLERAFLTYWRVLAPLDLPEPIREFRFSSKRKWRFDFAWPEAMLAVELHGGTYTQGRHTRGAGFAKDREKINAAQVLGWTVLEYPSDVLAADPKRCIDEIVSVLKGEHG